MVAVGARVRVVEGKRLETRLMTNVPGVSDADKDKSKAVLQALVPPGQPLVVAAKSADHWTVSVTTESGEAVEGIHATVFFAPYETDEEIAAKEGERKAETQKAVEAQRKEADERRIMTKKAVKATGEGNWDAEHCCCCCPFVKNRS